MTYVGESYMDCGYFTGAGEGLLYFPPKGSQDYKGGEPIVIPWSALEEEDYQNPAADKKVGFLTYIAELLRMKRK